MYIIGNRYVMYRRFYPNKIRKVEPIDKPGDPAYESPEREQKGKRDFLQKGLKNQKNSGENFARLLSLTI